MWSPCPPGWAPELVHDHVVITAHLDHVGGGRPDAETRPTGSDGNVFSRLG